MSLLNEESLPDFVKKKAPTIETLRIPFLFA